MPKALHRYEVLRRPIVTEKSTLLGARGKYVFEVAMNANKPQIKDAVEQAFDVHVTAVNTMIVRGKTKRFGRQRPSRQPSWKKAVVTVQAGEQIEIFEGV
jgi:large subunit ribosomal protein L23